MGYYETSKIESMEQLRRLLGDEGADSLNWLFLSTSGVHGSYATLDEVEDGESVTVLLVQPRTVRTMWGHVQVSDEDKEWLSDQVATTLRCVAESQEGNLLANH